MSVPVNLVPYRLLPILLLFTPLLLPLSSAAQNVTYKCLKRGDEPYIVAFIVISGETVDDIYGKGAEDSCGLKSKNITGRGTNDWPYFLNVNISGIGDVNNGVCGIDKKGDVVELTIVTRTSQGEFASSGDKEAKIRCDFSTGVMVNTQMEVHLAEQKPQEINVNITLEFNGSPTELTVGTKTFLKMNLWSVGTFNVIEPYRCWAMRNANDVNKVLILDDYCSVKGAPVKLEFNHFQAFSAHHSIEFPAFRFFDSDILYIRCMVDLCLDAQHCFVPDCSKRGKRSVSERNRHLHTASTDASIIVRDKGSSKLFSKTQLPYVGTLFPISVFLVVILVATVIGLVIKLTRRKNYRRSEEF